MNSQKLLTLILLLLFVAVTYGQNDILRKLEGEWTGEGRVNGRSSKIVMK